jgi:hypothetical protein
MLATGIELMEDSEQGEVEEYTTQVNVTQNTHYFSVNSNSIVRNDSIEREA